MLIKNLPNILTISRIALVPILIVCFYNDRVIPHYIAATIFVFASITDYFDGMLARKWKAQTNFGKVLDPIADKLLVASTLMMLVHLHQAPVIPALAILCREILVSGMREYMSELEVSIPVSKLGKVKTGVQMVAILLLILGKPVLHMQYVEILGQIMLWVAAMLTLITGFAYCKAGFSKI